jgi:hypothetical protein
MRPLILVFFVVCAGIVAFFMLNDKFATPPEPTAANFLQALQKGDVGAVVNSFGDVTCSCPPKGGYGQYLKYESGLEPNLAFLLGHPFEVGEMSKSQLREQYPYLMPWEKPTSFEVVAPLSFDPQQYSPMLLPLPMAFGKQMNLGQFQQFVDNPDADKSRGLCLRLRPTLEPGFVKTQPLPDLEGQPLKEDTNVYIFPRDAGQVVTPANDLISRQAVEPHLPRLTSVLLHLKMERRGSHDRWLIARFRFSDAIVRVDHLQAVKLSNVAQNGRKW